MNEPARPASGDSAPSDPPERSWSQRRSATKVSVLVSDAAASAYRPDEIAAEEPLAIQARGLGSEPVPVSVTMRTPGNDFELAAGFLFTEGLVAGLADISTVRYCDVAPGEQNYNVVTVDLAIPFTGELGMRNFYATSSCGICGKASLDQVTVACAQLAPGPVVGRDILLGLQDRLRQAQGAFDRTGGLHGTGVFSAEGDLLVAREDVGRHNAVDKVIGHQLLAGRLPLTDRLMAVSGRVSFEIVQKAARAGIAVLCAVSAPTSLAVDAADRLGLTLVGFMRGERFNVYTHAERVDLQH